MRPITVFMMSTAALVLAGCATPAAGPPPAAAAVAAKSAPAATTDNVKIPYGYTRVVMDNGEERFCRNDLVTGSRTERQKICLTKEQLEASQNNSQQFIDSVQSHGGASTINSTPGGGGGMGH